MNKKRPFGKLFGFRPHVSLNIKFAAVVILAAVLSIFLFFFMTLIENQVATKVIGSDQAKAMQAEEKYGELFDYIAAHKLEATDSESLQAWLDEERYTEIVIYGEEGDIFSAGIISSDDARIQTEVGSSGPNEHSKRVDLRLPEAKQDAFNRIVKFSDGEYYVFINVYMESGWYRIMDVARLAITAVFFLIMVITYNKHTITRVINLSNEVRLIRDGDLNHNVKSTANDEIGALARDVDDMRSAILDKMDSEKAARDANTQLITSMSHDIRTPLTSLIGYLDIIESGKYEDDDQLIRFISSCRDKAFQLKGLSDKLFQYFLVYSDKAQEREVEIVDAGILFQQLLIEHISEVTGLGHQINLQYTIPEGTLMEVDISAIQRIFDNLFSNIIKYANDDFPIEIKASVIMNRIKIILSNHIWEEAKLVESTRIGVKTCKRLVETMNGVFRAMEEEKIYTTEILFPVWENPEKEETEDESDNENASCDERPSQAGSGDSAPAVESQFNELVAAAGDGNIEELLAGTGSAEGSGAAESGGEDAPESGSELPKVDVIEPTLVGNMDDFVTLTVLDDSETKLELADVDRSVLAEHEPVEEVATVTISESDSNAENVVEIKMTDSENASEA